VFEIREQDREAFQSGVEVAVFMSLYATAARAAAKARGVESSDHYKWNTLQRSFRGHGRADAVGVKASALAVMTLPAS